MKAERKKTVLLVEDDELYRRAVSKVLADRYEVRTAESVAQAVERLAEGRPDLVLLDMMLPEVAGIELLHHLKREQIQLPVLMLTAVDRTASVVEAIKAGALDYLTKPLSFEELLLAIERAFAEDELRNEVARRRTLQLRSNQEFQLLGNSAAMERVREQIATVGPTNATVLVRGETGTGKELIARNLHAASPRASGAFVAVNCGAVPRDLFEAEFFGHAKGAFTSAEARGVGKFQLAHRGTLLLDEVGELPAEAQVKLLRALEEQEFYPVGGSELVRVDVRVVASTHRDLRELVDQGRFREDLYFRLNVYCIEIPPLRLRQADVLPLAEHFLEIYNQKFDKSFGGLEPAAARALREHPWPGNVRELRNSIERIVLAESGDQIGPEHLFFLEGRAPAPADDELRLPEGGIDLAELEKSLIQQALEKARYNKARAARLLNISPATFYYRVEKYGLVEKTEE